MPLHPDLTSWTTPDLLQASIASLERELQRLDPGRSLAVPDALLRIGPVPRLVALRFQRQDDLLFVLRRRLAQMSLDQPLAECLDEFRSLRALLDELGRLRRQNAQLRQRECRFDQSALLRRRPLRQCSTPLLQALVVALQNELGAVHDIVAELQPSQHPLRHLLSRVTAPVDDAVDVDRLVAELTGAQSADPKAEPDDDDLDLDRMRSSLQQLGVAVRGTDFASDSPSRAARDAFAFLERQLTLVERTLADQHDLVRDGARRLREQRLLNLKLTGVVQELLGRDGAAATLRSAP